ncbi:MAG TPA: apolipoprotein N-acyltransferase [Sulfurospirillum arcachonense]|nr:apolipoprotein N-acyltransferase [Sulfurospirillum arcachonense]HIP44932.1 apolipoprotein N-acyltransferase [Sulfurospirillum arcachonense]
MEVKKQIYLSHLAYESFDKKFSRNYFSTFYIIKGFFIALCLSLFIYLEYFSLHVEILNTILAVIGFYGLLTCEKKTLTWVGFFIGVFWFYWIGFGFGYYDLVYLIPLVIIGFGLIYGLFFWIISFAGITPEIRALLMFGFVFFSPFGFNWFKPELILINSYFSTDIYLYGLFLIIITIMIRWKIVGILLLIALSFFNKPVHVELPKLDIAIPITNLDQNKKWKKEYRKEIVEQNFFLIKKAIKSKKDLIILHESAFPLYLNLELKTLNRLKKLSYEIAIVTGGLHVKENLVYNSSYFFSNGKFEIADKVVLVPFGEKIPLPKWAVDIINNIFFNGADDYKNAQNVFDFEIKNYSFRNAICYEATTDKLYENSPKYMIAISNNAWFTPSIEPTLQNLLLKLHAKKYNTIIYHSANSGISGIITP